MTKPENAQFLKGHRIRELAGASRLHPMAPPQEVAYALIDMIVDCSIGQQASPVAEVRRPPSQQPREHGAVRWSEIECLCVVKTSSFIPINDLAKLRSNFKEHVKRTLSLELLTVETKLNCS